MHLKSRNGNLYVRFIVENKEVTRSLKLKDTQANRRLAKKDILPKLRQKIISGEYKKVAKNVSYYSKKYLKIKEKLKSYKDISERVTIIEKTFGNRKIDSITRLDIKEWLISFDIKNISKKNYLSTLKGIFEVALDDEAIKTNIVGTIKLEGGFERVEVDPFSPKEVEKLLNSTTGQFRNFLGIAFYSGARIGELLALTLNDIEGFININKSKNRRSNTITTTKTNYSIRKIPIFDNCKPFLEAQKKEAIAKKRIFLFASQTTNKIYSDASSLKGAWRRAIKKSGVRHRKLYNTRHTFATGMLRSKKISVLELARILGHSNTRMVLTTYAGFIESEGLNIDTSIDIYEGTNEGTFEKQAKAML